MNFEEFQHQARLYVIGALDPEELDEFEREREKWGNKAEDIVIQCSALHESFTLSLRSGTVFAVKERVMAMVRERKQVKNARNPADTVLTAATKETSRMNTWKSPDGGWKLMPFGKSRRR
jgi:hypothetical protein